MSMAARRAVTRWAWRLFRREWRQQILVLKLLIIAVAETIMGAAAGSNTLRPVDARLGIANHRLNMPGEDPNLASDIERVRSTFGTIDVTKHATIPVPGATATVDLRDQDPKGAYGAPILRLV